MHPELNGTIKVAGKKQKHVEPNPYEAQINSRIKKQETPNGFPKVTFNSKDFYDRAKELSTKVPIWNTAKENPIYMFVPECEQPVKTIPEDYYEEQERRTLRCEKLSTIAGRERNLQLAGTMALQKRAMSPESKLRQTRGFVTKKRLEDNFEVKNALAQKEEPLTNYSYK